MLIVVASVLATACFAILYQVPKRALAPVGLIGLFAWGTLNILSSEGASIIVASFTASLIVGLLSEGLARVYKLPVTVFSVAGLVTLVPGTSAYAAMRYFVVGQYTDGLAKATVTLLAAVAIAGGLVVSGTLVRLKRRTSE